MFYADSARPGTQRSTQADAEQPVHFGLVADVVVDQSDPASGAHTGSSVIPLILRSTVPLGPTGGAFSGLLTGGNGRGFSPGQISTYEFDVPAGLHDLDLGLAITDTNYNLQGTLVDPNGLPLDVQSTVTSVVTETASLFLGQPNAYGNTLQFFRRDPQAGRWKLVLIINDNVSGRQTALPFTATIGFNGVQVQAAGVPNDASVTLPQDQPVRASLTLTNTGNTTKDFFVDPRLAQTTRYALPAVRGSSFTVPLTATFSLTQAIPTFFVPPESTDVSVAAESMSPTVPINMDLYDNNGAPPYGPPGPGGPGSPDSEATAFLDPFTSHYAAVASIAAPEVPPGFWVTLPS